MLPAFIIDEIQQRERERVRRDDRLQPRLEIPPPPSFPPPDDEEVDEEQDRGHTVIDVFSLSAPR